MCGENLRKFQRIEMGIKPAVRILTETWNNNCNALKLARCFSKIPPYVGKCADESVLSLLLAIR